MYSLAELFAFSVILSLAAAFMAHKHGHKSGLRKGYIKGNRDTVASLTIQLAAHGIEFRVVDRSECQCHICVAERAGGKQP